MMSGAAVRPQYMQGASGGGGGGGDFPSLQRQQEHHSQSSFNPYSYNVPPDGSINFHGGSLASYQQQHHHQPSLMQAPPSTSPPFPMESSDSNQTSSSMQSNGNSDNSLPHSDDSAHGLNGMKLESVPPQEPSQHRGASADALGASAPLSGPQSNGITLHSSDPFSQNANGSINGFSALLGGGNHSQDVPGDSQDFHTDLDLSIPQDGPYFAREGQQQNGGQSASAQNQNHRQQLPNGPSSVPLMHSEHFEQAHVSMPHRNTVSGAHAPFAVGNLATNFLFTNGGQPSSMNGAVSSWPQAPNAPSSAPNGSSLMPPPHFNMAAYHPGVQGASPSSSPMGHPMPQQNGQENQQQQLYLQQHQHFFQQGQGQQNFQHHQSFPGTMVPVPSGLSASVAGATMGNEQTFPFPHSWRSNGQEASNGGFHNQQPTMNAPPNASSQQASTAGGHGRGPAVGRPAGGRSVVHMNGPHPAKHKQKRPRRAHALIQRDYPCDWIVNGAQCTKAYGTLNHLNSHRKLKGHGQKKTSDDFREVTELRKARKKELGEPQRRPNGRGEGGAVAGPSGTQQQSQQQQQQQPAHHQHPHLQQLQLHLNNTRQASQSQFPSNPQQQQEAWQRNQDRMAGQQMGMRLQNDPGSDEDGDGSPDVIASDEWVTDSNRQSADQSPEQGMASGMVGGFAPLTQQHLASSSSATYQPDVRHWSESVPNQSPPPSPPARASFMYSSSSSEMSGNASEEESLPVSTRQTRSKANRATENGTATRGRRRGT